MKKEDSLRLLKILEELKSDLLNYRTISPADTTDRKRLWGRIQSNVSLLYPKDTRMQEQFNMMISERDDVFKLLETLINQVRQTV